MAVMAREAWTDERLDDLNGRISDGFREGREEIRSVRGEMQALREETRGEFQALRGEMRTEFQALRGEMGTEFQAVRGEMGTEFQAVRGEMGRGFQAVRGEMGGGFAQVNSRIDRLQLVMIGSLLTAVCTLLVTIAGFVVDKL